MATQIGFREMTAVLPASDIDRARRFYEEKLGMTPAMDLPEGLFYRVGDSAFTVYPAQGPASGQHTQAALVVDDLRSAMNDLKSWGVAFQDYDLPTAHTEGGVLEEQEGRGAFFKDSEGNLIALIQVNPELRSQLGV
jgi:catechol 2,3-dioxygenase-like lactoylglutathione lyase family enzyme